MGLPGKRGQKAAEARRPPHSCVSPILPRQPFEHQGRGCERRHAWPHCRASCGSSTRAGRARAGPSPPKGTCVLAPPPCGHTSEACCTRARWACGGRGSLGGPHQAGPPALSLCLSALGAESPSWGERGPVMAVLQRERGGCLSAVSLCLNFHWWRSAVPSEEARTQELGQRWGGG